MKVDVTDLTVSRGGRRVLDDVSLTAEAGAFLGVVGPNGAGKTTLLQTVNGTLSPESGSVRVGGDDVHALSSRAASRRVATLPQGDAPDFEFTVREVVEMGRYPHAPRFGGDPDPGAVDRALDRTATARFADRPVPELSGGERQRVLLARALAQAAPVLLLDEPTASLDVNHQVRTLELARDAADDGHTVVGAIHDLDLAARYCDELVLLAGGEVVASGRPREVLTADAVEAAFGVRAAVASDPVTGSPLVTALPDSGTGAGRVHVLGGGDAAASLCYPLRAAGFQVSVGPVPDGDRAAEVAGALGGEVLTVPPFEPPGSTVLDTLRERVAAADATVVADVDVTPGRLPLLEAVTGAEGLVVVGERSPAAQSAAGADGERALARLRGSGRVVPADEVPRAVASLVAPASGHEG